MEEVAMDTKENQDIDVLQTHGVNAADIKKLKQGGIGTLKGLQMVTKKKLCAIKVSLQSQLVTVKLSI